MKLKKRIGLALAMSFTALAPAAGEAPAQYTLQALPATSPSTPVDGRSPIVHDNAALAAAFNAKGRKAPLDLGHSTEFDATAPAVGWVVSLSVAEDGSLIANVELTEAGARALEDGAYGYTSPTLYGYLDESNNFVAKGLKSLALTNNPALEMSMNFSEDTDIDEADEQEGSEGSGEADCTGTPTVAEQTAPAADTPPADAVQVTEALSVATASLTAAQAQVVSLTAQVASLTAERDTAVQALAALKTEQASAELVRVVEKFTTSGHCTPAERQDLLDIGAAVGAEKLTATLSKRKPMALSSGATFPDETPAGGSAHVDAETAAFLQRNGLSLESYAAGSKQA